MAEPRYDIDGRLTTNPGGFTREEIALAWREQDEATLAEHGGDPDQANRALGLSNLAGKMQDQALTNDALREGTEARRVHDEIVSMDPDDREALYPSLVHDDNPDADA